MWIKKLIIKNYKIFENQSIDLNENLNIFVGDNSIGKTTILESLTMVLTGKLNGAPILKQLTPDWFSRKTRENYKNSLKNSKPLGLPKIEIEAYFGELGDEDCNLEKFKGTNNSLKEDRAGIKLVVEFDDKEHSETYKDLLRKEHVVDIPIELYKAKLKFFGEQEYENSYNRNLISEKFACIDSTKKDYSYVLDRFISDSLSECLNNHDMVNLSIIYRSSRYDFIKNEEVVKLNSKLEDKKYNFQDKVLSLRLRENEIDSWKKEISIYLNEIPFENIGFGTQNMLKTELFLQQNSCIEILIIEEPENNLTYSNMSKLISKLSQGGNRQIFISTHSSFVANKLGLNNLHMVTDKNISAFKNLSKDTYNYFVKLPDYNTLRLLLAGKVILVEGAADELIVQKSYQETHKKLPIEDGVDVMPVHGLPFKRFCELARLINKKIVIVTDNDGTVEKIKKRYKEYSDILTLCCEENNDLPTLEPSVLEVNMDKFEDFKGIIYKGKSAKNKDELLKFMKSNKTDWSLRIFESDQKINYPEYIIKAIKAVADEQ